MSSLSPDVVVMFANNEVGYYEKATNNNLYSKTENKGTGNYTKYAYEMDTLYPNFFNGPKNGYDWCALFVCWLFVTAYGYNNALSMLHLSEGNYGASCTQMKRYYQNANAFGNTPSYGAQIFFGDGDGSSYHTGIVVSFNDNTVTTIEGNAGDKVSLKSYYRTYSDIIGYGYPSYQQASKTVHEIALEVIDGLWGSNPERRERLIAAGYDPDEVQAEVNNILYGSTTPSEPSETNRLLTVDLNLRDYDRILVVIHDE